VGFVWLGGGVWGVVVVCCFGVFLVVFFCGVVGWLGFGLVLGVGGVRRLTVLAEYARLTGFEARGKSLVRVSGRIGDCRQGLSMLQDYRRCNKGPSR